MADAIPPFGLRMPPDLKKWLHQKAHADTRSLNSEIVKRLQESRLRDEKQNAAQ